MKSRFIGGIFSEKTFEENDASNRYKVAKTGVPEGIRTPVYAVKGRCPGPG